MSHKLVYDMTVSYICRKPVINAVMTSYTVINSLKPLFTIFCKFLFKTYTFDLFCLESVLDYHYIRIIIFIYYRCEYKIFCCSLLENEL